MKYVCWGFGKHRSLFIFDAHSFSFYRHCIVARTKMFGAAYANTPCYERKLFVSFPPSCFKWKLKNLNLDSFVKGAVFHNSRIEAIHSSAVTFL